MKDIRKALFTLIVFAVLVIALQFTMWGIISSQLDVVGAASSVTRDHAEPLKSSSWDPET